MQRKDLDEHLVTCVYQTILCEHCSEEMMVIELKVRTRAIGLQDLIQ